VTLLLGIAALWYLANLRISSRFGLIRDTEAHTTLQAELLKVSAGSPDSTAIRYAADLIKRGRVVAVPTDTFYGLAADPFNLAAVEEIYRVKGRPENRALPILVDSIEQAAILARDLPLNFVKLAKKFWPGALTIVVEASHTLPLKVTANKGRVALRWPKSRVACALIEQVGSPITGTSANISGFPSCSNAQELIKQLGERLPLILDSGDTGASVSSTIVSLEDDEWKIVREGQVPEEEIAKALADSGSQAAFEDS
jgi:tRNA threonylcarbamoyl adenosine modification protein (Sua5/YciO/YrdC/YwlC family)